MKTIVLGDTHGRTHWKKIVEQEFDKVIFIGDYFDTHENTTQEEQINNFMDILEFEKKHPGKVVLLLGNHDYHYLSFAGEQYSGYTEALAIEVAAVLQAALDKGVIKIAHVENGFLFTHAGVTKGWCFVNEIDQKNVEASINEKFKNDPTAFRFYRGDETGYGDHINQGPLWVRPNSLLKDMVEGFKQIVGHTTLKEVAESVAGAVFIDTLGTSGEYLEIKDGYYRPVKHESLQA